MITINGLSKRYKNFYAVKDVSTTFKAGEVYGLVGKNGAGKSTLFKLILGLTNPTEGSVSINDSSTKTELNEAKKRIGFYMGPSFYPYLNARDNLQYVAKMKNIKDKGEIDRVLKLVDLEGVKKPFKTFSLGMKQRLGIANALLGDPDIILLDEPINGLDPQGILEIRQIISDLGKKHNKTVVVSSHILSELELVADRFGIINNGILLKEFDHSVDKDTASIIVETSDNEKAVALLASLSPVLGDTFITIPIDILENSYIQKLIDANIQVLQIKASKKNLEQQYFALTGGH